MAFQTGDNIGDYEVIGELGAGGIGQVYKVRHRISQRTEAMKVLLQDQLGTPEMQERFIREIRVLAAMNHPNIASLHTAFQDKNQLVMVMEFVEGMTLAARLRNGNLPIWTGVEYIGQVLQALIYAHARGVIHRDIKPGNIMLTTDPIHKVKLLDFGLAANNRDASVTAPGTVMGSLFYMSPEQVRGERVDARSDLYSVGVTLYEVVTGQRPFEGPSSYAIMNGHLTQPPKPPAEVNREVSPQLSAVVLKSLAKNPDQRYQSADDFLRELDSMGMEKTYVLPMSSPSISMAATAAFRDPHVAPTLIENTPPPSFAAAPPSVTRAPAEPPKSDSTCTPSVLQEVSKQLAAYIGPIADIIVKKAARTCTTPAQLYEKVAQEIDEPRDREKFLASRKRAYR